MAWAMRKKYLSKVMVQAVMSLYDGAKARVTVRSANSEKFEVKVGVHQESVLLPLLFAIALDVITEKAKRGVVNELLYADDLVLMSETTEDLKERFWNWKNVLESKRLKINTSKTKVMGSRSEGKLFKSKINPYKACGKNIMANSVLCMKCGNWVHGRRARTKRVTARLAMRFDCWKCRRIKEGTIDLSEKLCDEVETVNEFNILETD